MTAKESVATSGRRDEDDGLLDARHAIADAVMSRVGAEIPGLSPHFGEAYERSDDPEAVLYHKTGGQFRFLAFAFSPWRMWDLHVGVVPIDAQRLSVGFHISERAGSVLLEDLGRLGAGIGAAVQHREDAVEYQANLPPVVVSETSTESLAGVIADLCRRYAPVAAAIECPREMRDGG